MSEHTPGPWFIYKDEHEFVILQNRPVKNATAIAIVYSDDKPDEANARLIAAAPELLEALKKAREYVAKVNGSIAGAIGHENTIVKPDLDLIDATISKAEGRS